MERKKYTLGTVHGLKKTTQKSFLRKRNKNWLEGDKPLDAARSSHKILHNYEDSLCCTNLMKKGQKIHITIAGFKS